MAHALNRLVQALQPVLQQGADAPPEPAAKADPGVQHQALQHLRKLLQDDDANAQRHFAEHVALFGALMGEHYPRIRNAIDSLALDEALELVEALPLPP